MNLVVFDCDGTLADSQHAIVRAMTETFVNEGLPPPPRARVLSVVGLSLAEAMARLEPHAGRRVVDGLVERYRLVATNLRLRPQHGEPLFPGVREMLADLASRQDLILGLATGKSRLGVEQLLRRENLDGVFQTIQTADTHPSKPHPSMLYQAMSDTGVGPERTVMVGDSSYDAEMARAAGVPMIGVSWGYHDESSLRNAGARVIVRDLDGLEPAIRRVLAGDIPRDERNIEPRARNAS